ncbi:1661_t:CDS:1, partial [Acaulospora morrowiae]
KQTRRIVDTSIPQPQFLKQVLTITNTSLQEHISSKHINNSFHPINYDQSKPKTKLNYQ